MELARQAELGKEEALQPRQGSSDITRERGSPVATWPLLTLGRRGAAYTLLLRPATSP